MGVSLVANGFRFVLFGFVTVGRVRQVGHVVGGFSSGIRLGRSNLMQLKLFQKPFFEYSNVARPLKKAVIFNVNTIQALANCFLEIAKNEFVNLKKQIKCIRNTCTFPALSLSFQ